MVSGLLFGGGSFPTVRSPRQCMGPSFTMPRRVCVVIGPFSEWKSLFSPMVSRKGFGLCSTVPLGSPRSHARLSKSPKAWQLAHAASPLLEVRVAS